MLKLESCVVDLQRRLVHRPDGAQALTEQEAGLLSFLADRPGEVVPRQALLTGVMGYTGAVVTRALDAAMSRLRQKIERDSAAPVHLLTVRGVGYRFEPLPVAPPSDGDPPLPFPAELDPFVGREGEVAAIADAVEAGTGLTTILGGPGSGKTRTAIHVGHALIARGRTVAFAALGGIATGDEAAAAVAAALGGARGDGPAAARIARVLALRPVVVVVDDLGPDRPEVVAALAAWRAASPGSRWLVTAAAPLRLPGERRHPLGPLSRHDATALLLARADAVRPGWGAGAEPDVARIVEALDGNPLALELAAGRAVVLSPAELADTLDRQRFSVLTGLRAAIRGAWDQLGEAERRLLARCAVFPAPFSADDAAAVHPDGPVLDPLQALVERSVVRCRQGPDGTRFAIDDSVRRFAREQLDESGEADDVRRRAWAHAVEHGEALVAALPTPRGDRASDELRERLPHLQRALDGLRSDDPDRALRAALVLSAAYDVHGTPRDRLAALGALPEDPRADRVLRVRGLVARAHAHRELASGRARADADRAVELLTDADPPSVAGRVWALQATLDVDERLPDRAAERLGLTRRAAARVAPEEDPDLAAGVHVLAGRMAIERGDVPSAADAFAAAEAIGRAAGARRIVMVARLRVGLVARERDQLDDAERAFQEALEIARRFGPADEAVVHGNFVGLHVLRGDLDAAVDSAARALALYRRTATLNLEASALGRLGTLRMARGELEAGRALLEEAVILADSRGDVRDVALAAGNLGQCLHWLDRPADARPMLARAVALLGPTIEGAYFEAHLAAVAAALDDVPAAVGAIDRAAAILDTTTGAVLITVLRGLVSLALARAAVRDGGDPEVHLASARAALEAGRRARPDSPVRTAVLMVVPTEVDAATTRLAREIARWS